MKEMKNSIDKIIFPY